MDKKCGKCKQLKSINSFHKDKKAKDGHYGWCKDCVKLKNKFEGPEIRKRHFKKRREYNLTYMFDISKEESAYLVERSINGVCDICGHKDPKQALSVDHDHTTGKIRGLLCRTCNSMLGMAKDNKFILEAGSYYLQQHHSLQ